MGIIAKIEAWLQGKKTFILIIGAIVAAVVAYIEGQLTLVQMVGAIWAALTAGALRSGINKSAPPPPKP